MFELNRMAELNSKIQIDTVVNEAIMTTWLDEISLANFGDCDSISNTGISTESERIIIVLILMAFGPPCFAQSSKELPV
jgi:hypothetical protein